MKHLRSRKGYVLSPFVIAALVILGASMVMYFAEVDSSKAKAIAEEGRAAKETLAKEEDKTKVGTEALFAAYQAAYDAANYKGTGTNPMSDPVALEMELETGITKYLGGSQGGLTIDVIDNKDIRNQGFIVNVKSAAQAQGQTQGQQMDVDKYVNARIFLLQEKYAGMEKTFMDDLAKQMECRFDQATCKNTGAGIDCTIQLLSGQEVRESLKKAVETARRMRDGVMDVQNLSANAYASSKEDMVVTFEISKLTAVINPKYSSKTDRKGATDIYNKLHCCKTKGATYDSKGALLTLAYCADLDTDYDVSVELSGAIDVKASLIDYATLSDDGQGGYEICTKSPIMLLNGEIVPLQTTKQLTVPYKITYKTYESECKPTGLSVDSVTATQQNSPALIAKYSYKKESLTFPLEEVKCQTSLGVQGMKCESAIQNQKSCACEPSGVSAPPSGGGPSSGQKVCFFNGKGYAKDETLVWASIWGVNEYTCLGNGKFRMSCAGLHYGRYWYPGESLKDKYGYTWECRRAWYNQWISVWVKVT